MLLVLADDILCFHNNSRVYWKALASHFQEIFNLLTQSELTFRMHCCEHQFRNLLLYFRYYVCLFLDLSFAACLMFLAVLIGFPCHNCSMRQEFLLFFCCSSEKVSRYDWMQLFFSIKSHNKGRVACHMNLFKLMA